jgi:hypothetical protein
MTCLLCDQPATMTYKDEDGGEWTLCAKCWDEVFNAPATGEGE